MKNKLTALAVLCFVVLAGTGCVYVKNDFINERPPEYYDKQELNLVTVEFKGTDSFPKSKIDHLKEAAGTEGNLVHPLSARFNAQAGSRPVGLRLSVVQKPLSTGERFNIGFAVCTFFIIPFWETKYSCWKIEFMEKERPVADGVMVHTASDIIGIPPFIVFALFMDDYYFYDYKDVMESKDLLSSIYNTSLKIPIISVPAAK